MVNTPTAAVWTCLQWWPQGHGVFQFFNHQGWNSVTQETGSSSPSWIGPGSLTLLRIHSHLSSASKATLTFGPSSSPRHICPQRSRFYDYCERKYPTPGHSTIPCCRVLRLAKALCTCSHLRINAIQYISCCLYKNLCMQKVWLTVSRRLVQSINQNIGEDWHCWR